MFIVAVIFFTGYILGKHARSRRLPPPATPPAPGDDAATRQSAAVGRGSASAQAGGARPVPSSVSHSRDTRSVTDNQQRCHHDAGLRRP